MTSPLRLAVAAAVWNGAEAFNIHANHDSKPIAHPKERHFADYVRQTGRVYSKGSMEYHERFALFLKRSEIVETVNNHPHKTWTATLNHFADRTEHELKSMLGYKRSRRRSMSSAVALRIKDGFGDDDYTERASVDWSEDLSTLSEIRDQGDCGSCWAVTATTVLDAHAQRSGRDVTFATQEVVDCVPNPSKCGGAGGCDGATVELAFQYAMLKGLGSPDEYGLYTGKHSTCSWEANESSTPSLAQLTTFGAGALSMEASSTAAGSAYGMVGWARLETNSYSDLMKAVTEQGPVAIALVASTSLFLYSFGIFDDCDWTVNHAVTLVGYGIDGSDRYWLIQNSWGPQWGEAGRLRIARKPGTLEGAHCGEDTEPQQGIACENETEPVRVCGTCGVLYDSVVPRFVPA